MIRILLFAGLAEAAGLQQVTLDTGVESLTIKDIQSLLAERYPNLGDLLEKSMAAVNQEYAAPDKQVTSADEVAFIPPVSGG